MYNHKINSILIFGIGWPQCGFHGKIFISPLDWAIKITKQKSNLKIDL